MRDVNGRLVKATIKRNKNEPDNHLRNGSSKYRSKLFCIAVKRKMRANKLLLPFQNIKVELIYNQPSEVTSIRYFTHSKTSSAVCPSCNCSIEREYQKHCDQCGQLLGWKRFIRNDVKVIIIKPKESRLPDDYYRIAKKPIPEPDLHSLK